MIVVDKGRHPTAGGRMWTWEAIEVTSRGGYRCRVHVAGVGTLTVAIPGPIATNAEVVEQIGLAVDGRRTLPPRTAV